MRNRPGRILTPIIVAGVVIAAAACDEGDDPTGPEGTSEVQVLLTDAPTDSISDARVWISQVVLAGTEGDTTGNAVLFDAEEEGVAPKEFDLLDLRNGITEAVTDPVDVESGVYEQLRLVVDSARVELAMVDTDDDGEPDTQLAFQDGSTATTLFVPSGGQTGIKVQLDQPIDADAGQLTVVTVDFDVNDSFVIQASPRTGIRDILFTPVLTERGREEGGAS